MMEQLISNNRDKLKSTPSPFRSLFLAPICKGDRRPTD